MPGFELLVYIGMALGAVYYLRAFLRAQRQLGGTTFGLEREAVLAQRGVAISMMFVIFFFAAALYVFLHRVMPAIAPPGDRPRPTPAFAVTLVGTPGPVLAPARTLSPDQLTSVALGTPLPSLPATEAVPNIIGCPNPQVALTAPGAGGSVAGPVEVKGTANITDFAFYKLEVNGPGTEGNWQTLSAGSTPVADGVLGTWDASIYTPGSYNFRLVVYDAAGNSPIPCVIPITIVAIP